MSNPAVFELVNLQIAGERFCVEDNFGEAIHIHIGAMRFDLSVREFLHLARTVKEALNKILTAQGISLDDLTPRSLIKMAPILPKINVMKKRRVRLCELTLEDSYNLDKFANGDNKPLYGFANDEKIRISRMASNLEKYGYPLKGQLIITDDNNNILDGERQFAALNEVFGSQYEITVLICSFCDIDEFALNFFE